MDLRLIFNDKADYSNPIEPSVVGGMKMAKIIKEISYNHDFSMKDSVVYKWTTKCFVYIEMAKKGRVIFRNKDGKKIYDGTGPVSVEQTIIQICG